MRLSIISCLSWLFLAFAPFSNGLAATPLTEREHRVCRNLSHCLRIVDEHPIDSFDYTVLVEEFRRYGTKGRDALLKRISNGDRTGRHAADLLSLTQDSSALAPLKTLAANEAIKGRDLARRTLKALTKRLDPKSDSTARMIIAPINLSAVNCPSVINLTVQNQGREMPFFESDIARPDRFGAYRPGATYRIPSPLTDRGDLNSAVSLTQGWLAGYAGGLILYDPHTGVPKLLSDAPIITVQAQIPEKREQGAWALIEDADGLLFVDALQQIVIARFPGQLSGLARAADNRLLISTTTGLVMGISPKGEITSGCGPNS